MSAINVGDRVSYRVGKGYAEARVSNIAEGMATLTTENGKLLNRKVSQLSVTVSTEPSTASQEESSVAETAPKTPVAG